MIKLMRLLLAFLIALAVPLQGTAAIAADICLTPSEQGAAAQHGDHHGEQGGVADPQGSGDGGHGGAHCATVASIAPAIDLSVSAPFGARIEAHPPAEPARMLSSVLDRPPLAL